MNHQHPSSSPRGFTITETLVATALLAMSVMSLYEGLVFGYRTSHMARLEVQANTETIRRLESLVAASYTDISGYCQTDSLGRAYTANVSTLAGSGDNAKLVTIDVSWWFQGKQKKRTYSMVKGSSFDQYNPSNSFLF